MIKSTKTDWQKLSSQKDEDIDYSDIPETNEKFWETAEIILPHNKVDFTIKIDEDLALWLKNLGDNSDQAVNNIIRAYFLVHN
jgi:uncharacterized protein (DUF4415 family)